MEEDTKEKVLKLLRLELSCLSQIVYPVNDVRKLLNGIIGEVEKL